jgi:tetratricopeptide (TPR) repeat protein
MDILSPNTVLTAQSFAYSNDNRLFNLKSSRSSKQGNHTQEKEQTLFRKQDGKAWVVIVREPSGGIKAYSEQEALKRKALALKGIPSYLPLENISKAKDLLSSSKLLLSDYQIEVLPGLKGGMMREENHGEAIAPAEYYCAVTHELMEDPHSNELGNTYEKSVLEALLKTTKKDPLTRQFFQHIFPNRMLKTLIQNWKEQNLAVVKPGFPYIQERNTATAQRFLRLAQEFENENNSIEAEENYKKALKYTDDPRDYKQYAQFLGKLRSHEKTYKAYLELGKLYEKNNQLVEAKTSYEAAKVLFPEKEELLKIIVDAARKLKNTNEVVKALKALAGLYEKNNRLDQATENYEEIFKLSEERSVLERLSILYGQQQNKEKCFEIQKHLFELELEEQPDKLSVYDSYKKFLKANGQTETAAYVKKRFLQKLDGQKGLTDRLIGLVENQASLICTLTTQNEIVLQQLDQIKLQSQQQNQNVLLNQLSQQIISLTQNVESKLSQNLREISEQKLSINKLIQSVNSQTSATINLRAQSVFIKEISSQINTISSQIESLKKPPLYTLDLSTNPAITDIKFKSVLSKHISNIGVLVLKDCYSLTDNSVKLLTKKFINLTSLDLNSCNKLTDQSLEALRDLTALSTLNLGGSFQITYKGLRLLKNLTALTSLDFNCNIRINDQSLEAIKDLATLSSLNLSSSCDGRNEITDKGLESIKNFTALSLLDLSLCRITDQGLESIKNLTTLTSLNLPYCRITDKGLEVLKGLITLTSLDLSSCHNITDKGLKYLEGLTKLTKLKLRRCENITDTGLESIKRLTALTSLRLEDCSDITDKGLKALKAALPKVCVSK